MSKNVQSKKKKKKSHKQQIGFSSDLDENTDAIQLRAKLGVSTISL